jgi:hypothetical protein
MNKDSMNQGVQILLERMDTNPEEFEEGNLSKWADIMSAVTARKNTPEAHLKNAPLPFLTDPEVNALYDKLEDVRRENFTADVLRRLAEDSQEQPELWETSYTTSRQPLTLTTGTGTAIATWGKSSITTAQALSLGEAQKEELVKALDEYRKQHVKEKKQKAIPR